MPLSLKKFNSFTVLELSNSLSLKTILKWKHLEYDLPMPLAYACAHGTYFFWAYLSFYELFYAWGKEIAVDNDT